MKDFSAESLLVLSSHPHTLSILLFKEISEACPSPLSCPGSLGIWILMLRMLSLNYKQALQTLATSKATFSTPGGKNWRSKRHTCLPWPWRCPSLSTCDPVPPPRDLVSALALATIPAWSSWGWPFLLASWYQSDCLFCGHHWDPGSHWLIHLSDMKTDASPA